MATQRQETRYVAEMRPNATNADVASSVETLGLGNVLPAGRVGPGGAGGVRGTLRRNLTYPVDGICYTALSLRETSNAALGPKLKNPTFPLKR